jgi:hypothetical protein
VVLILKLGLEVGLEGSNLFARSNLPQDNLSLVRLGSRFSVWFPYIFGAHLDTAKAERAPFSLSGEPIVSGA